MKMVWRVSDRDPVVQWDVYYVDTEMVDDRTEDYISETDIELSYVTRTLWRRFYQLK